MVDAYCGNDLARFSSGVMWVSLREEVALRMAALTGCVSGAVCILVHNWSTLLLKRRCFGVKTSFVPTLRSCGRFPVLLSSLFFAPNQSSQLMSMVALRLKVYGQRNPFLVQRET
jgi:hypothetical protein